MGKITISSLIDIEVTPNAEVLDITDHSSIAPNKLRAVLKNQEEKVIIREGIENYPDYIQEWNVVKALEKAGKIAITRPLNTEQVKSDEGKLEQAKSKAKTIKLV